MAAANLGFYFFLLLPLQFSLASVEGSDMPIVRIIIPLFFCAWLLHGLALKKISFPKPLTLFAFSSFLAWAVLSVSWSENSFWALRKAVFWLNFFPLFLVLADLFENEKIRSKAIQGLLWGGGLIAGVGIIQFTAQFFIPLSDLIAASLWCLQFFLGSNFAQAVSQYPSILVNVKGQTFFRAFAFFPDPHIFAYYCSMILPLALYQALQRKAHLLEKLLPAVLLVAVLLSFSRASYVALLAAAAFLGVFFIWQYKKNLSVAVILLAISLCIGIFFSPIAGRFMSSFSHQDGSVTERSRLWKEAVSNISQAPLLGVGLGNYPLFVKPSAEPREPIYVHNLYLDLAVELGITGLSLFLLFIFSCLPKISLSPTDFLSYSLALYLSLLIFLAHSLFEYPLFSLHILILFITLLALLYVEKR